MRKSGRGPRPAIRRTAQGPRVTRIALMAGEESLSSLLVHHLRVRIGCARVHAGGIGAVATPEKHRRKGYARRCLTDATAFMAERGWDMGLLFGIRDFYDKFGYACVFPEPVLTLKTRDAERAVCRHRCRAVRPGDIPAMLAIYDAASARRTGSCLRTAGTWDPARKGSRYLMRARPMLLTDRSGRPAGYMLLDNEPEATVLAEVAALSDATYESILAMAARDAVAKRAGELSVHVPADHPLVEIAGRLEAQLRVGRPRCAHGMGRIIDQPRLFQSLAPELSRRVADSRFARHAGTVRIRTELGTSTLDVHAGRIRTGMAARGPQVCLQLPQPFLAQLVMGYRSVASVAAQPGVRLTGCHALELLATLFPLSEPYMWQPDRF